MHSTVLLLFHCTYAFAQYTYKSYINNNHKMSPNAADISLHSINFLFSSFSIGSHRIVTLSSGIFMMYFIIIIVVALLYSLQNDKHYFIRAVTHASRICLFIYSILDSTTLHISILKCVPLIH